VKLVFQKIPYLSIIKVYHDLTLMVCLHLT
jgi:hypothetical protein